MQRITPDPRNLRHRLSPKTKLHQSCPTRHVVSGLTRKCVNGCWPHVALGGHPAGSSPKRRIAEIQARCNVVSPRDILKIMKGTFHVR